MPDPVVRPARMPVARRVTTGVLLAGVALVVAAGPAAAHVTVSTPEEAKPGGFTKLVFRVPNEREDAGTVKLALQLPRQHPLAFVSVRPVPGWTASAVPAKLPAPVHVEGLTLTEAVGAVTWTARKGTRIAPGQFQEFELSVGPLPEGVASLTFPTEQTYSGGEVVSWDQPAGPGGEEPEHPAPELVLARTGDGASASPTDTSSAAAGSPSPGAAGSPSAGAAGSPSSGAAAAPVAASDTAARGTGSDGVARGLAAGGLVAGVGALALALRRRAS